MPTKEVHGFGCGHHLVHSGGVSQATLGHGDPVLVEVLTVDTADRLHLVVVEGSRKCGRTVGLQRCGEELRFAGHSFHPGQSGELFGQGRRVETKRVGVGGEDADLQVGGIGGGEIRREGRLGATGPGHRPHGQPTDKAHQQEHDEIAAPPPAEGSPVAVAGRLERRPPHGDSAGWVRMGKCCIAPPSTLSDGPVSALLLATYPGGRVRPRASAGVVRSCQHHRRPGRGGAQDPHPACRCNVAGPVEY